MSYLIVFSRRDFNRLLFEIHGTNIGFGHCPEWWEYKHENTCFLVSDSFQFLPCDTCKQLKYVKKTEVCTKYSKTKLYPSQLEIIRKLRWSHGTFDMVARYEFSG